MIVLNLKAKVCMSHLLLKPTFDTFSLIEGEVTTFNRFQVDGRIHKDFFDEAFEKEYSTWGEVRDFFFQVIRGKKTPLNFKFILSLAKDQFESFLTEHDLTYRPAEIQGLYLNFRYDGLALQCITGTSMNTFTIAHNGTTIYTKQYIICINILYIKPNIFTRRCMNIE